MTQKSNIRAKGISSAKAHRQSERRNLINRMRLTRIKTFIKKVLFAIDSGNKKEAAIRFIDAQSEIMKGVSKKVLKLNTASRKVSALNKKLRQLNTQSDDY